MSRNSDKRPSPVFTCLSLQYFMECWQAEVYSAFCNSSTHIHVSHIYCTSRLQGCYTIDLLHRTALHVAHSFQPSTSSVCQCHEAPLDSFLTSYVQYVQVHPNREHRVAALSRPCFHHIIIPRDCELIPPLNPSPLQIRQEPDR